MNLNSIEDLLFSRGWVKKKIDNMLSDIDAAVASYMDSFGIPEEALEHSLSAVRYCKAPDILQVNDGECVHTHPDSLDVWVEKDLPGFTRERTVECLQYACSQWESTGRVKFNILTDAISHGLCVTVANIDGRGDALADCNLPCGGLGQGRGLGRLRLDYSERYSPLLTPPVGMFSLPLVLTHELGHWLGLDHGVGIMAPTYDPRQTTIGIANIQRIKNIYPRELMPDAPKEQTLAIEVSGDVVKKLQAKGWICTPASGLNGDNTRIVFRPRFAVPDA